MNPAPQSRYQAGHANRRNPRGFTLIEMLIVIAIIAIFSAGLLAMVTAPGYEQKQALQEQELEAGAGVLFARIAEDAHEAASLEARGNRLVLREAGPGEGDVFYVTDARRRLHRMDLATTETVALLDGEVDPVRLELAPVVAHDVEGIAAEPLEDTPGLWRVNLSLESNLSRPPVKLDRQMDVAVGKFWTGGAR